MIVVYTAIAGGYDELREPEFVSPRCRYVCFSDDPDLTSETWEIRPLPDFLRDRMDRVRRAKQPKLLPHRFLRDAETSVWVDGNLTIRGDLAELAGRALEGGASMAVFEHPEGRESIWAEAEACIHFKKDDPSIIEEQVRRYRSEAFESASGIPACMLIIRRHGEPSVMSAMEAWWEEVCTGSRRDQLSFIYACSKAGAQFRTLSGNVRDNPYVLWSRHDGPSAPQHGASRGAAPAALTGGGPNEGQRPSQPSAPAGSQEETGAGRIPEKCRRMEAFFDGRAQLLEFPRHVDPTGALFPIEFDSLPFAPRRAFFIQHAPASARRGGHAHRTNKQVLICLAGSVRVELRSGALSKTVVLNKSNRALFLDAGIWAAQTYETGDALLLVLASEPFDPLGYCAEPR